MKKQVFVDAAIITAVGIFYELLLYIAGIQVYAQWWNFGTPSLRGVIILALSVYLGIRYRKSLGGFISYGKMLAYFLVIFFFYTFFVLLFQSLLMQVIDKEFGDELTTVIIDQTVESMEKFGAPESTIDKQVKEIEKMGQGFTLSYFALGLGIFFGMWLIISLILALILKKNKPEFAE